MPDLHPVAVEAAARKLSEHLMREMGIEIDQARRALWDHPDDEEAEREKRWLISITGVAIAAYVAARTCVPADEHDRRVTELLAANSELVFRNRRLSKVVTDLKNLIAESHGVIGLHPDDIAPWDEVVNGGQRREWLRSLGDLQPGDLPE